MTNWIPEPTAPGFWAKYKIDERGARSMKIVHLIGQSGDLLHIGVQIRKTKGKYTRLMRPRPEVGPGIWYHGPIDPPAWDNSVSETAPEKDADPVLHHRELADMLDAAMIDSHGQGAEITLMELRQALLSKYQP